MMSAHKCIDCHKVLSGPDWMIRCKRCYAIHKRGQDRQSRPSGFNGTQAGDIQPAGTRPVFMDRETYRKVLSLCHPDKHDNSPAANEVTQKLLEQRRDR